MSAADKQACRVMTSPADDTHMKVGVGVLHVSVRGVQNKVGYWNIFTVS